jgi:hypothetical protein
LKNLEKKQPGGNMHIVLTQAVADELRKKYTVLELDTMPHPGGPVPAFCVLPVEQIAMEMSSLEKNVSLHEQLIDAIKNNDCNQAMVLCENLFGKFGGELDSFYEIVLERTKNNNSTSLVIEQQIT